MKNGEPYLAAVYNPNANELFFAAVEKGAAMNGMPIRVNDTETLEQGFAVVTRAPGDNPEGYARLMDRLTRETNVWMHSFGTMLGVCFVATGGADFFAGNSGFDHDNLAPPFICREAGAPGSPKRGK